MFEKLMALLRKITASDPEAQKELEAVEAELNKSGNPNIEVPKNKNEPVSVGLSPEIQKQLDDVLKQNAELLEREKKRNEEEDKSKKEKIVSQVEAILKKAKEEKRLAPQNEELEKKLREIGLLDISNLEVFINNLPKLDEGKPNQQVEGKKADTGSSIMAGAVKPGIADYVNKMEFK